MILEILMAVLGYFFKLIVLFAPKWNIWPNEIIEAFAYFGFLLSKLNIIFPIDTLFICLQWFVNFLIILYSVKLLFKGINFLRGSGEIKI